MTDNGRISGPSGMPGWTPAQCGFLRVFRAVVNHSTPDAPPADWEAVLRMACLHGVDPYLFHGMRGWPAACLPPPPLLDAWRRQFLGRTAAAVRVFQQLGELLAALHAASVETLPLKGAWLAEHVYEDIALRPMTDIDLLIRPTRLADARAALAAAGYRAAPHEAPDPWCKEQHFRHPSYTLGVELQWHLWTPNYAPLPEPAMDRIWADTRPETVAGQPAVALPPGRHLIYLAYHPLAHHWRVHLRAHLDLVLLGRRYGPALSPEDLAAEADAWGLGFGAPFVWRVAHDLCAAEPPATLAGWTPPAAGWHENERSAACAAALPECLPRVTMSVSLSDYLQAPWWRRLLLALRVVFLPPGALRTAHPLASRRFGLVGGYAARGWDLARRRGRDLLPGAKRRAEVGVAAGDMAARLRLDRWLHAQEKPRDRDTDRQKTDAAGRVIPSR